MQSNRSVGTKPEERLRKALWHRGLRGYRKNDRRFPGTPDIYFPQANVAVFVHGCFWHGCDRCTSYSVPKTNSAFWIEKVRRNRERFAHQSVDLEGRGITVLVFWECELKSDFDQVVEKIQGAVSSRKQQSEEGS